MHTLDAGDPLKIIQITDTHLNRSADERLLGMQTSASLAAVLDLIRAQQPQYDLMLATGDLSQDHSRESYLHLQAMLKPLQRPHFWLAGNHDDLELIKEIGQGSAQKVVRTAHWQILLLNSQVIGSMHGRLAATELEFLHAQLQQHPNLHTLVCLHHHPVPMHSRWLDNIGLKNADELFAVLGRHQNVRALLCGHVHQESENMHQGLRVFSTPSTCIQFLPKSQDFGVDPQAPGYRWLHLHADGRIDTAVERVQGFELTIDHNSKGY